MVTMQKMNKQVSVPENEVQDMRLKGYVAKGEEPITDAKDVEIGRLKQRVVELDTMLAEQARKEALPELDAGMASFQTKKK